MDWLQQRLTDMTKTVLNLDGSYWLVTASTGPKANACAKSAAIYARASGSVGGVYTDGASTASVERVALEVAS
jgi:hypothetical protein